MTQAISGKNVLITGTARGIGRAMAIRFVAEGARVTGLDLDAGLNAETARLAGEGFIACSGDVASAKDVASAVEQCGPVDILINNAATVAGDGLLHQVSEQAWDRVSEVCLKSVFLCTRAVLPGMMKRRGGVIISMSSVNALSGIHLAAYTAAKGGILSLTRLLAQQYGAYGIRANAICPGTINTETSQAAYAAAPQLRDELYAMYPAGRFGEPADIAECALWLSGDGSRFVNGSTIVVDGGMSAVHRLPSVLNE
jgi:NAD(P)-dependent dehydrogenase (short-subunit alcohol dehydrogenase family)